VLLAVARLATMRAEQAVRAGNNAAAAVAEGRAALAALEAVRPGHPAARELADRQAASETAGALEITLRSEPR
jgi:hypothetical protein